MKELKGNIRNGTIVLTFAENKTIRTHAVFEMDENMLDQFIGDGNAKLTVSMEVADKEFGRGVSVMASVTITVNQDDESINMAYHYAGAILKEKVRETIPKLNKVYDELKAR